MTGNLTLAIVAAVLIAAGVYLLTERSLTRILVGVLVMSNGVNILFLIASGPAGAPPLIGMFAAEDMADPLPQAMVLTAIVITMAVSAFVVTMAYRSFQLNGHDEVSDDIEDRRIRELAERDDVSDSFEDIRFSDTGEDRVSE
ncbi:Na(+)/H(+) antiporter subunit C [Propioniciclava sinopodophylli]|uniref:Na(+)/H(+) antiporter subunit C n=1 Tax=Propioniciclava sinopodophylli TaxID=1837344 RepID=A0A4Q9KD42_9ACTN|nr:Na(+)/H(+) antiporter subunit C [Propioniciclava sinopodophylli]TBT84242.1 Na(+)/H(+) antiporter subunit C [Propioniciclava sinopodophylli]